MSKHSNPFSAPEIMQNDPSEDYSRLYKVRVVRRLDDGTPLLCLQDLAGYMGVRNPPDLLRYNEIRRAEGVEQVPTGAGRLSYIDLTNLSVIAHSCDLGDPDAKKRNLAACEIRSLFLRRYL